MVHSVDIPYLDNESINKYFESLAKYIIEAGIGEHRILVVGGAAMALKYIDNRSTLDIDICIQEQSNLYACCRKVMEGYGLPEDWINADVMHSESFSNNLFDNTNIRFLT